MISFRNVSFRYPLGDHDALHSVSLEIGSGKTVVVGSNGAGKTTMLKCVAGLLEPSEGELWVDGTRVCGDEREKVFRKVVYVPQDAAEQLGSSSVYSEVALPFGFEPVGKKTEQKRVRAALEMVSLLGLENRFVDFLSTGEKKKVVLARAFLLRPRVLLVDEPTSNLDESSAREIMSIMGKMSGAENSVVLSTNALQVARDWTEQTVVLKNGKVLASGDENVLFDEDVLKKAGLC